MYVESSRMILYCNFDGSIFYFDSLPGLIYLAVFALQLILGAEQLRVTPYEGALPARLFGETP